jgi:hypothetical protein
MATSIVDLLGDHEENMRGKAKAGDLERKGTRKALRAACGKQNVDAAEHRARLMEIGRGSSLHISMIDPEGSEVLNVSRLIFGRVLNREGDPTPDIRDVLELLVEAAEEHVLPFE